jgi:hypothetical protein
MDWVHAQIRTLNGLTLLAELIAKLLATKTNCTERVVEAGSSLAGNKQQYGRGREGPWRLGMDGDEWG